MYVHIRPLGRITDEEIRWTSEGYVSEERYRVTKTEAPERTVICLDLERLPAPYVKYWDPWTGWTLNHYREMLAGRFCLGAFLEPEAAQGRAVAKEGPGGRPIGLFLSGVEDWHKTLWIWEFHVKKEFRHQGIGRSLVEEAARRARRAGMRVMVAEAQNTNVPGIRAYRGLGFEVGSVDLSYYTNDDSDPDKPGAEVAVFMKRKE